MRAKASGRLAFKIRNGAALKVLSAWFALHL
jgi:hypothetical protein